MFINIKKYKIVFKIIKDYLIIIFFLMAIKDLCFKQIHNNPVAMPYDLDMEPIWDFFAFSVNMI